MSGEGKGDGGKCDMSRKMDEPDKAQRPRVCDRLEAWAKRLKREIAAIWLAYRDPRTPFWAKAAALLCVGYALSPIDLIPDFIPVLGYLDDLLVLPLLAALCIRLIPAEVLDDCRARAEGLWDGGRPKKWIYAIPIVLLWALVLILILRAVLP